MDTLSVEERQLLLRLARRAIEMAVIEQSIVAPALHTFPERLQDPGASFVTITGPGGELRGCIGTIEAHQPLALDVFEHAIASATEDYRFPPVRPEEVTRLEIEISRLTTPIPLAYETPSDLPGLLKPGVDGVVLRHGTHRATFLPQVWEKLPDAPQFLAHLCQKMGAPADLWQRRVLQVEVYQVEEFREGTISPISR